MKPNTRIDNFLAKIAGDPDANTAMKPRSPEEYYLNQIAENGGGGGGTGGGVKVYDLKLDEDTGKTYLDAGLAAVDFVGAYLTMSYFEEDIPYFAIVVAAPSQSIIQIVTFSTAGEPGEWIYNPETGELAFVENGG